MSALVVMVPVREGSEEDLRAALTRLREAAPGADPFARVASTHFARFVLIPALLDGNLEPVGPPCSYLLFTADFDVCRRTWLRAVAERSGGELDAVLGHCVDYPGSADVRALGSFVSRYSVGVGFSVASYNATVAKIQSSLDRQSKLRDFAAKSGGLSARELHGQWRELQNELGRRFAA
jgi:hypothetical protein